MLASAQKISNDEAVDGVNGLFYGRIIIAFTAAVYDVFIGSLTGIQSPMWKSLISPSDAVIKLIKIINSHLFRSKTRWNPSVFFKCAATVVVGLRLPLVL